MLVRHLWPSRPSFPSVSTDFDQIRRDMMRAFDALNTEFRGDNAGVFPPVNLTQDNDKFYLRAEVPGIAAQDLSISVLRNRVTLSGKREIPRENERASYHRKERAEGGFSRVITLPAAVDSERVEARCVDGILELTLPKADEAKPRQIAVKS